MTAAIEGIDIPLYTIDFDHDAFARLSAKDREAVWYYVQRLVDLEYMVRQGRAAKELAFVDLREYCDFNDYLTKCRKIHTGNAIRDALRAEHKGYYSQFFNPRVFVADIVAVNTSAPARQGGPMSPHYFKPVEERGGYPLKIEPEIPPNEPFVWIRHWGIFRKDAGRRQGTVVVDEQLVGYCILRRCSEFMMYTTFLGHFDYLRDGVTYKMHLDLIKTMLDKQASASGGAAADRSLAGTRYLFYSRYFTASQGLRMWKRRMLFRPGHFQFDYPAPTAIKPPEPLAVISLTANHNGPDYQNSRFNAIPRSELFNLALHDDTNAASTSDGGCAPLLHVMGSSRDWAFIRGLLIGASVTNQSHPVLIEAFVAVWRDLAPRARSFIGDHETTLTAGSPAGEHFGKWLLGVTRDLSARPESEGSQTLRLLASLLMSTAYRAKAVASLLRGLAPENPGESILAIGGGIGLTAYFLVAERPHGSRTAVAAVDHVTELHPHLQELYQPAPAGQGAISLTLATALNELTVAATKWDVILFDAAVWRIPEANRGALFRHAWESLGKDGLLIVNAVVRSDDATMPTQHDRNFRQALTRRSMIELMTFDKSPKLYRAATSWQTAEEPSEVPASEFYTDSFLVAGGQRKCARNS